MPIEIKFIATDKSDLASQLRAYLGEDRIIMDRPKITCSEPISYQEAVDGTGKRITSRTVMEEISEEDEYGEHALSKAQIRSHIYEYMNMNWDAKTIQAALASEWDTDLSLAAIGGMMGGIKRQKEKQAAHNQAVDDKILTMKTCDPLLIADSINRELGGNWTEEKVARRLKELVA